MNIKIKTNEISVVCGILGAAKTTGKHQIYIETDNPELKKILDQINPKLTSFDKEEVFPQDEDSFRLLDEIAHKKKEREIRDIAGVVVSNLQMVTQRIPDLVATFLFLKFGIISKSKIYFPKLKSTSLTYAVIDDESKRKVAEGYLKVYNKPYDIVNIKELPLNEQINHLCSSNLRVAFLDAGNPLIWVINGFYDTFDTIQLSIPCFITVKNDQFNLNEREVAFWNGCFPINPVTNEEQGSILANTWKTREDCQFNHLTFLKQQAKPNE